MNPDVEPVRWRLARHVPQDPVPSVGITATRIGLSLFQREMLRRVLAEFRRRHPGRTRLHEGHCVGGDEQALLIARELGYEIAAHPSTLTNWTSALDADEWWQPGQPVERNKVIVKCSWTTVAMPYSTIQQWRGSGTWAAIRETGRLQRSLMMIYPDEDDGLESYAKGWE